ncbi:unnamed protein product, partial [Brassica rapa]
SPRGPKSPKQSTGRASMLSPRTNVLICVLMDSHGRPVCADRHSRTHTDSHGQTQTSCVYWRTPTDVLYSSRGPKSPEQATGRVSVLSPRTNVLICVLMDSHGRHTAADVVCVLTDSHRPPLTSCVCWRTPTDVICVLNRQHTWAKITQTIHGKGQRTDHGRHVCADGQPQTAIDVLCVLADTHGRPVCTELTAHDQRADMCTDGQPWTSCTHTGVMCVLTDTHGRPVQPTWAKITRTVHGKGQRADSKDQRADIQPMWAKITQTVHGKGQRGESKDQRADMCTDGQPRMSSTNVLCVLADTHGRPVCTEQTAHMGQNHPNSPREGSAC